MKDAFEQDVVIEGVWWLTFGNGGSGGATNKLYFAAGINNEVNGLFGSIAIPEPDSVALIGIGMLGLIATRRRQKFRQ